MQAPNGHAWNGGRPVDRRLWHLIAATRGGLNRARILHALRERPHNANDLAQLLRLDYKTVRHHLDVLRENGCVMLLGESGYAALYTLSPRLQMHFEDFLGIWERIETGSRLQSTAPRPSSPSG